MPYIFRPTSPRGVVLAWIVIWILFTATMLGVGIDGLYENHRFAGNSAHTQGWIEETYQTTTSDRFGIHTRRTLSYSYSIGGVTYSSGVKMVAGSTGRQYRTHDSIPVIYLRDEPGDSRPDLPVEEAMYRSLPLALIVVGCVSLGFGFLCFTSFAGRPRRH